MSSPRKSAEKCALLFDSTAPGWQLLVDSKPNPTTLLEKVFGSNLEGLRKLASECPRFSQKPKRLKKQFGLEPNAAHGEHRDAELAALRAAWKEEVKKRLARIA